MLTNVQAIVLAAGKATRLKTNKTKLTEKICGQELIIYPLAILEELSIPITLVIGFQGNNIKNTVESYYPNHIQYVEQFEPTGTATATKLTRSLWHAEHILVTKADIPLITTTLLEELYKKHIETHAAISFIAAHNGDPSAYSYSRVIKDTHKNVFIRKHAELSLEEIQDHCCVNGGIYLIAQDFLNEYIDQVTLNHATNEFHLSDLVNLATTLGKNVTMIIAPFDQIRSVDTYQELWAIEQIKRSELIRYWMERGVRFSAAQSVHIDLDVEIGTGSFIGCSVHLLNGTKLGNNTAISSFSIIEQATIGDHVIVHPYSIIRHSIVGNHAHIGPFAHMQDNTTVGDHATIGNFVETKRTSFGSNSKAKHLSYLGDATIGSHVNIGAGTITCNYDGTTKHATFIEDHVFIGSNNSLVAPVTIQKGSFTAAGSVITKNVPPHTLAIARATQVNKEGYLQQKSSSLSCTNDTALNDPSKKQSLSFMGAIRSPNDSVIDQ